MTISPTQEIIADIKAGKMVILVDEEDRENEGDLVIAAANQLHCLHRGGRGCHYGNFRS